MKAHLKRWLPPPVVAWLKDSPAAGRFRNSVGPLASRWWYRGVAFDEIYGEDYFELIQRTSEESAAVMAESLLTHFSPRSVVDVGCGTGSLLASLKKQGVETLGMDKAHSALRHCAERNLDVLPVDFTLPGFRPALGRSFDLATSFEVGHQIPESSAAAFVSLLTGLADLIVFSSDPGQDDRLPLNPQPPDYWIRHFATEGFPFDETLSAVLKREWDDGATAPWFSRYPMVFRRKS